MDETRRDFVKKATAGLATLAFAKAGEGSVSQGGAPVDFPDFTRGGWRTTATLGIVA